ncbi:MAG: hypothetical protein ABS68_02480 [Niastella sp. SCN 39-18]|nr:thioredoxin family protein [Sphingobacteriales bacterium]ODT54213.1 MAG: hypothetical protein ABS68_02480 [Niastella sp. SCN 39-18]
MKLLMTALLLACVMGNPLLAQSPYTSYADSAQAGSYILNGIISKYAVMNNAEYSWYKTNQEAYAPSADVLEAMEKAKGKFTFLVFGGTWCEDTHFIIPKFFKLQELSGIADKDISFIGVTRLKTTLGNLTRVFNISHVPTIIILKDGKETGRLVEYGSTGLWDKELVTLLK